MKNNLIKISFFCVLQFIFSSNLNAQETQSTWLNLSYEGFLPKVFDIKGKSASELYNKTIKWAKAYYPNFKNELIFDSTNYQIKIRSIMPEAFHIGLKRNLFDVDYTLIISFKDEKYRVQIDLNSFYYNPRNTKYRSGGETQQVGWDQRGFYISEKEIDPQKNTGYVELYLAMYEISTSLFKVVNSEESSKENQKNDDW